MLRRIASRTLREPVLRASSPAPQPATGTSAAVLAHQYQLMQQSRGLVSSVLLSSTRDSYESKKMAELRSELKTRGLSSTGRKDELIKRLVDHDSVINGSTASTAALPLRKKSTLASLRKEDGGSKDTLSPPGAPTTQAGTKTNKGNPPSADASRRNDKAGPTVDAETARAVEKGTKPLGSLKPSETPANLEPGSVHNAAADGLASDANAKASPGTEEQRGVPVQKTTPPGLPPQKAPAAKETFNIQIPYYPDPPEPQIEIPIVTSYTSPHIKRSDANTASSGFEPKAISVSASSAITHAADLSSHGSPDASESSEKAKGIFSEILSDLEKQSGSDLSAVNKGVESAKQAFSSIGEQAKGAFASAAGQVADATGASSSSSSASSSSSSSSSSSGSGSSGNKSNRPLTDEERTGALVLLGIVTGGFVLGGLGKPKKQKHDDKEHDAKSASDGAAQAPAGSQGKPVAVTPLLPVAALPQADGSVKSQGEGEGSGSAIPTPAGSKVKAPIMCVPKGTQVASSSSSSSSSSSPLASAAFSQPLSSTTLARLAQLSTCEVSKLGS
ncbi:hypothetical protein BCV70DRAFT_64877 [Testicularia cyperi]|uniref:SAP domain-containing protein n=1 Tax=Testicularia cyperi TaxID=1882483 RepID=A0A317XJL0_9BASI|nr:hypothetical protein BCV70DRAFT_64877 [Testicularia cyperi]